MPATKRAVKKPVEVKEEAKQEVREVKKEPVFKKEVCEFKGTGVVFFNGRRLCKFSKPVPLRDEVTGKNNNGVFRTDDAHIIQIMKQLGYKYDVIR